MSLSCQLLDGSTFDVFITGETSVLGSVFSRYETQKSLGAKSGLCGGWPVFQLSFYNKL